jgi:FG-GAP-like repeat
MELAPPERWNTTRLGLNELAVRRTETMQILRSVSYIQACSLVLAAQAAAQAAAGPRFPSQHAIVPVDSKAYGAKFEAISLAHDFDGDGQLDALVVVGEDELQVHRGTGLGTFASPVVTALPFDLFALEVAVADWVSGGAPDLVVLVNVAGSKRLCLMEGDGAGGFQPPVSKVGNVSADWILAAELNGDGKSDLLGVHFGGGVVVWLGDGHGGFLPSLPPVATSGFLYEVSDLNGDLRQDLVAVGPNELQVLVADSSGTLVPQWSHALNGAAVSDLAIGDVDGDGLDDLAVAPSFDPTVQLFLGLGNGSFALGPHVDLAAIKLELADWNGDGLQDLIASHVDEYAWSSVPSGLMWVQGLGGGHFDRALRLPGIVGDSMLIAVQDVDGDGQRDLVSGVPPYASSVAFDDYDFEPLARLGVALGDGQGGVRGLVKSAVAGAPGWTGLKWWSRIEDATGDGLGDALGGIAQSPALLLARAVGAGAFSPAVEISLPAPWTGSGVRAVDVTGDGVVDLATGCGTPNQAVVLPGDGVGGFGAPVSTPLTQVGWLDFGDVNGDSRADLVQIAGSQLAIYLGQSNGSFVLSSSLPLPAGGPPRLAQLDSDGILDIAVGASAAYPIGSYFLLFGDGAGGIASRRQVGFASGQYVQFGDFDGDGDDDAVYLLSNVDCYCIRYELGAQLNNGSGGFAPARIYRVGKSPYVVQVEDVDGDGIDDVLAQVQSGTFALLRGSPSGELYQQTQHGALGTFPIVLGVSDVDGDGLRDVVLEGEAGELACYLNLGP